MSIKEVKHFAKKNDLERALIKIDGENVEFEIVDWSTVEQEDKKELLAYFFTFEADEDFEGMAGAAWLSDFLPFAICGDIDDDTHAEWDDLGGGGLLVSLSDATIHYYYHEMDEWPRQVAASFGEFPLELLPEAEEGDE